MDRSWLIIEGVIGIGSLVQECSVKMIAKVIQAVDIFFILIQFWFAIGIKLLMAFGDANAGSIVGGYECITGRI